jgi:hypothetical protein
VKKILIGLLIFVLLCGVSWGIEISIFKIIAFCFGWQLSIKTATGIWLVSVILNAWFSKGKSDK